MLDRKIANPCQHKSGLQQAGGKPTFTVIIRWKCYQDKNVFGHSKSRSVYGAETKEECLWCTARRMEPRTRTDVLKRR